VTPHALNYDVINFCQYVQSILCNAVKAFNDPYLHVSNQGLHEKTEGLTPTNAIVQRMIVTLIPSRPCHRTSCFKRRIAPPRTRCVRSNN